MPKSMTKGVHGSVKYIYIYFKFVTKPISIGFPITEPMHIAKGQIFDLQQCNLCDRFNWFEIFFKKKSLKNWVSQAQYLSKLQANKKFYLFSKLSNYMGKFKL